MNFLTRLLVWALLYAFVLTGAKAQEPEVWRGVICSSQLQLESVVSRGSKLGGALPGIQAVNAEEPEACALLTVVGVRGPPLKTIESSEGFLDVIAITVLAVATPQGLVALTNQPTWFTLAESTQRGA